MTVSAIKEGEDVSNCVHSVMNVSGSLRWRRCWCCILEEYNSITPGSDLGMNHLNKMRALEWLTNGHRLVRTHDKHLAYFTTLSMFDFLLAGFQKQDCSWKNPHSQRLYLQIFGLSFMGLRLSEPILSTMKSVGC